MIFDAVTVDQVRHQVRHPVGFHRFGLPGSFTWAALGHSGGAVMPAGPSGKAAGAGNAQPRRSPLDGIQISFMFLLLFMFKGLAPFGNRVLRCETRDRGVQSPQFAGA